MCDAFENIRKLSADEFELKQAFSYDISNDDIKKIIYIEKNNCIKEQLNFIDYIKWTLVNIEKWTMFHNSPDLDEYLNKTFELYTKELRLYKIEKILKP